MIGHADRAKPLRDYCLGLMMPCERKSVEPMAAITAPERTAAQHQSLLHFIGEGRWSDEKVLAKVRELVLPELERAGIAPGFCNTRMVAKIPPKIMDRSLAPACCSGRRSEARRCSFCRTTTARVAFWRLTADCVCDPEGCDRVGGCRNMRFWPLFEGFLADRLVDESFHRRALRCFVCGPNCRLWYRRKSHDRSPFGEFFSLRPRHPSHIE